MSAVAVIAGSPTAGSRARAIASHIGGRLRAAALEPRIVDLRELPAEDLLSGRLDHPSLADAARVVERAGGVVLVTPVYKASYTGLLKSFLDVLPQAGFAGKVILPIAVGASHGHLLAIDYALRPVLASMGAPHVLGGMFLLDQWLTFAEAGLQIECTAESRLLGLVDELIRATRARGPNGAREARTFAPLAVECD